MREILFKAKRIDNGEWVEGFYHYTDWIYPQTGELAYRKHYILPKGSQDANEIDINTFCQYTGLTDKNGNKIWENDVVDIQHYTIKSHKIKWGYGGFYVGINGLLCHYNTVCEVIGNIFDNPELIN